MSGSKDGYHPKSSLTGPVTRADFLKSVICGDLTEVAGIAEGQARTLKNVGVTNTFQLVAKYLSFTPDAKNGKTDCVKHCDAFYFWLKSIGVNSRRHDIVQAIAEKTQCTYTGMYNEGEWKEPS